MTEQQWLACDNPERVFLAHGEAHSVRKLVLFCARCCYLNPIPDRSPKYVAQLAAKWRVAERYADKKVSTAQLRRSWSDGRGAGGQPGPG